MWQANLQDEWGSSLENAVAELYKIRALFRLKKLHNSRVMSRSGEARWILKMRAEEAEVILTEEKVSGLLASVAGPQTLLELALDSVVQHGLPSEELPRSLKKQVSGWPARRALRDQQRAVRVFETVFALKQMWHNV
jgi:hypothetical protein